MLRPGAILVMALVVAGICANAGFGAATSASAASSRSISTTATVSGLLQVADGCSGAMSFTVLGGYAADDCAIDFGSTSDATTTLRISSSVGAFLSGAFGDHVGGCGPLINDTVGIKYTGGDAGVSNGLGCTASAMSSNTDYVAIPDAATNACAATTLGTTNTCTLAVGAAETGLDAPAGTYTGTLNLDVIG